MRVSTEGTRLRRLGLRILAAAGASTLVLAPSSTAQADDSGSSGNPNIYALAAQAVGIDAVLSDPSLPLNTTVDMGGYGASASLTSLGQSMADAGAPYSPYLYSLPGTVDGLSPNQIPYIPEPAGYVTANYPTNPNNTQAQGPYAISAESQDASSEGAVRLGVQQAAVNDSTVQAIAQTVANPDGSVHVQATTGVDLLNVGGLLDIGNITSTQTIDEKGSGQPTVTGSTSLGTVSLLGQPTGVLGGALDIFGAGVPVPLNTSLLPLLNQVLAGAGVTVQYVPASYTYTDGSTSTDTPDRSKTIQAVESAGLKVTMKQDVKSQGLVTLTYTVGRVYVSALNTASPDLGSASAADGSGTTSADTSSPGATDTGSLGSPAGSADASAPPVSSDSSAALNPSLATSPPAGAVGSTAGAGSPPSGRGSPGSSPQMQRVTLAGLSGSSFYLALILVSLVLLGASQMVRLLGVRLKPGR